MQDMLCIEICSLPTVSAPTYTACMRFLSKQQAYKTVFCFLLALHLPA